MEAPLRQIVSNAGEDASVVLHNVREGEGNYGYNAANASYGDMVSMGIIDPTKVTRSALQNAASIASMMIITDSIITSEPKKDDGVDASGAGGMGGMGSMGGMGGMM